MSKIADTNLWGIHAGKTGDADSLFLKKNYIAVGWTKMGDLSALKPDHDAFKARAGGGIDIVAHKDELGFEPPIIKVQVKSSEGSIGDPGGLPSLWQSGQQRIRPAGHAGVVSGPPGETLTPRSGGR
jgi:predicted Mrr-cat superfamily restriction endonuclease